MIVTRTLALPRWRPAFGAAGFLRRARLALRRSLGRFALPTLAAATRGEATATRALAQFMPPGDQAVTPAAGAGPSSAPTRS